MFCRLWAIMIECEPKLMCFKLVACMLIGTTVFNVRQTETKIKNNDVVDLFDFK